ncbi:MAG: glycosyltransferase family 39 protein, partial [Candidatus Eremiobacteraeota bacterium]|nr:glycosyltransferase family 39 protein [Candidatus Eremiobacteraeota bacterium]
MQRLSSRGRLIALLAIALLVRLAFVLNAGFSIDVGDFEAWASQLAGGTFATFYPTGGHGFADYPPGYLYVLWLVGHVYALLAPHGNSGLFLALVKAPAILMDLFDAAVLYALVRRYASETWALGAAAVFALNPAAIFVSSAWGQVDSVSGGLALLAVYLMVRAADDDDDSVWLTLEAWVALAASVLVKPQAAVLAPLFIAFAFAARDRIAPRVLATLGGIVAAFIVAALLARPFHPAGNSIDVLIWLKGIYLTGYDGYSYNSVNAFNLWTIARSFWQSDTQPIAFLSQHLWGELLFGGATLLILWRYLQKRTTESFVEASALIAFAFFILMTRMHERYVFDALLLLCACISIGRRYLIATVAVTVTLFANLIYSLQYLSAVTNHMPGVNAFDIWGAGDHLLSLVNVAAFFVLGFFYLNGEAGDANASALPKSLWPSMPPASEGDPKEGMLGLLWPLDYALSIGIGLASFVLLFINYWFPADKIFDEIYFARAAENYLTRNYIYESTHPPVTKLLITFSTWMFGGMGTGDTSYGWRFLDVVAGAAVVWLLYVFAKRITGSTLFASCAAILLALDGQHFVQSRIATPEAFVAFFSLAAIYTFYRFWIAAQERATPPFDLRDFLTTLKARGLGVLASIVLSIGAVLLRFPTEAFSTKVVLVVYMATGFYLVYRLVLEGRLLKRTSKPHAADLWLALFSISAALLVTSKWYGVMVYGVA